jgi:uncharacterized glyoxalase superfamily protein PhnB
MSKPAVKPVPDGYHTLTRYLICKGATGALDFYKREFGAEELSRLTAKDGKLMHAALRIGDSVLMLTDADQTQDPDLHGWPWLLA